MSSSLPCVEAADGELKNPVEDGVTVHRPKVVGLIQSTEVVENVSVRYGGIVIIAKAVYSK